MSQYFKLFSVKRENCKTKTLKHILASNQQDELKTYVLKYIFLFHKIA